MNNKFFKNALKNYKIDVEKLLKKRSKLTRDIIKSNISFIRRYIKKYPELLSKSNLSYKGKYAYLQLLKTIPFSLTDIKYFVKHSKDSDYLDQVCCAHCGRICKTDHGKYQYTCCPKCGRVEMEKRYERDFYNKIEKKYGDSITLLTKFKNYHTKIKIKCNICKSISYSLPQNLLREGACKTCYNHSLRNPIYWEWDAFLKESKRLFKGRYTYLDEKKKRLKGTHTRLKIRCNKCGNVYTQLLHLHLYENGCPYCNVPVYSKQANEFIDAVSKGCNLKFISKGNCGFEHCINANGIVYRIDGYNKRFKICLEYNGDIFHGNPKVYSSNETSHPYRNITNGELYKRTKQRERELKKLGYNVISVWEYDWNNNRDKTLKKVLKRM